MGASVTCNCASISPPSHARTALHTDCGRDYLTSHRLATLPIEKFPQLDLAFADDRGVTPLGLVMDIANDGYCGTVPMLLPGTYVPVLRTVDWQTAQRPGLTRGEKVRRLAELLEHTDPMVVGRARADRSPLLCVDPILSALLLCVVRPYARLEGRDLHLYLLAASADSDRK